MLAGTVASISGAVLASQSVAVPTLSAGVEVPGTASASLCAECGTLYDHLAAVDLCEGVVCTNESFCEQETGQCASYPESDAPVAPEQLAGCPSSSLPLRLVGTVIDEDGGWAHAVLHDTETGLTSVRRPGDALAAGHEVLDVERDRVRVITEQGVDCLYAGVVDAEEMRPARRRANTEPLQNSPTEEPASEAVAEFEESTPEQREDPPPGTYRVARSTVDAVANDPGSVGAASTRISSEIGESGETVGLRITGIGRNSALRQAGLRNGDVLVAVNGQAVDSPQRGIAVYQRLSTSSSVSVELLRRGEPRRLRVEVTD